MFRIFTAALTATIAMTATPSFGAGERMAALPKSTEPVRTGEAARPIAAWVEFCETYKAECRVDESEPEIVQLTPEMWRLVNDVNTRVNRTVKPVTDMEHWGVVDRWNLTEDGKGDCEDMQLLKRRKLAEFGLPRRAMLMTVALDENDEGHAVLMLRTDRGDLILDNKRDEVLSWDRTPYVYVKRESQHGVAWVSLNRLSGVLTTATRR